MKFIYLIVFILIILYFTGCSKVEHVLYEIEIKNGIILLSCPVIDPNRNNFTYYFNGYCVVVSSN
jgi:hypothetical protein